MNVSLNPALMLPGALTKHQQDFQKNAAQHTWFNFSATEADVKRSERIQGESQLPRAKSEPSTGTAILQAADAPGARNPSYLSSETRSFLRSHPHRHNGRNAGSWGWDATPLAQRGSSDFCSPTMRVMQLHDAHAMRADERIRK